MHVRGGWAYYRSTLPQPEYDSPPETGPESAPENTTERLTEANKARQHHTPTGRRPAVPSGPLDQKEI